MSLPVTPLCAPPRRRRSPAGWALGVVLASLLWNSASFSQTPRPAAPSSSPAGANASLPAVKAVSRPGWTELSPAQKQALAPLASNWNTISEPQKRKWLEISKNYSTLSPEEQATLNGRMNEWVTLSPQQRAQARLNFGKTKEFSRQLTPEEKNARWQAYQALSPEEKQNLAAKASPRPSGAATAVKPVAPQKLVMVPPALPKKSGSTEPASKIGPSQPAAAIQPAASPAGPGAAEGASAPPLR